VEPYRTEEFVVFASAKHPLSQKKKLTLADFARGPLIVREKAVGSNTWEILAQLERQGYELNVFMECESAEVVKVATMKGLGLGILWRDHLKAEIKRGDIRIVKIPNLGKMEAQTFIVYHKERALSSSGQDFLDLLHQSRQRSNRWDNLRKRSVRRGGTRLPLRTQGSSKIQYLKTHTKPLLGTDN